LKRILLIGLFFFLPFSLSADTPLQVEVWLDRGDGAVYYSGDAMTVYFKTDRPSFVTVYNIDSDGYVNILYPFYPGMDNYVAGGRTYAIPGGGYDLDLVVDEPVGIGYIEVVASEEPFYLDEWPFLSHSYEETAGVEVIRRINGDPFLAIEDINQRILPFSEDLVYSDDFAIYYVEQIVHYPRYLCSDCHVATYYHHDPYGWVCPTYYIVVYDFWYYNDFYYWDHYYAYDYYGYYYRYPYWYPGPSHVGPRYSRKYDYRVKDEGVYRTKGESTLRDGVVRVRGYAEKEATQHLGKETIRGDEAVTRSGDVPGSGAVPIRKSTIDGDSYKRTPMVNHSTVGADGESRSRNETKTRKSEIPASDRPVSRKSAVSVSGNEDRGSKSDVKRVEKTEGIERESGARSWGRTRSVEKVSSGEGTSGAKRRYESVSKVRNSGHGSRSDYTPARSSGVRNEVNRSNAGRIEERSTSRVSVRSENRGSRQIKPQSRSRTGSVKRSAAPAPRRISSRSGGSGRPSVRR
jgi:hypothetical protein